MSLSFATTTKHRIQGEGMTIAVSTAGDPRKPAILFIHGLWQSKLCWSEQMEVLAQEAHIVALDLAFHGETVLEPEQSPSVSQQDLYVRSINTVIEHFNLRQVGYIPVAWSLGGLELANTLLTHGVEGVRGIILVGTSLNFDVMVPKLIQTGSMGPYEQLYAPDDHTRLRGLQAFIPALTAHQLPERLHYEVLGYNMHALLKETPASFEQFPRDIAELVKSVPVLLINTDFKILAHARDTQALARFLDAIHERFQLAARDILSPHLTVGDLVALIMNQQGATQSHDATNVTFQEKEA